MRKGSPRRSDYRGRPGRSRSRSRSRSRERFGGGGGFRRRESPPFKRRKGDEWDDRGSPPRYRDDRRRRYDDYDGSPPSEYFNRGPPHRGSSGGKPMRSTAALFDGPMLTYKQFLEAQDESISPNEAEQRYEDYQVEYKRRQAKVFFNEHKGDEWFKEKYEPSYLEQKRAEKIATSQGAVKSFAQSLKENSLDFNLNATVEDINRHMASKPEEPKEEAEIETADAEPQEKPTEENGAIPAASATSPSEPTSIFIKVVPPHISRQSILELFKKTAGFRRLTLSEPQRFKNFNRLGWATYDNFDSCQAALKELQGNARVGEFELQLAINKTPEVHKLPKITPPVAAEESRIPIDLEQIKLLCMQLDKEKGIESNPLSNPEQLSGLSTVEQLDRYIVYMRKVHFFCYYCGEEYDDEDDLTRKCVKHLRGRKRDDANIEVSSDPWAMSLDTKIKNRINNTDNPDVYSGRLKTEQKVEKFYTKNVIKIEAEKYRCALCSKLFCGDQFVRKHQSLKHLDKIEEAKKKAVEKQFFENYFADPKRITPAPVGPMMRTPPGRGRGWGSNPMGGFQNSPYYSPSGYNRGNQRGRRPVTPRSSPREPPPGVPMDPRALKEYVDLDAPSEDAVEIDYRIGDLKKKKKEQPAAEPNKS